MAEIKTKLTKASALDFINKVPDKTKKNDALELLKIFKKVTHEQPKMWGSSIIGFGTFHYKSERSTQEGDWPLVGFSPRKQNLTLYLMMHNLSGSKDLFKKLGKHKTTAGCLYINKLSDVDIPVLERIIKNSLQVIKKKYNVK
jgi:hypothetical protein